MLAITLPVQAALATEPSPTPQTVNSFEVFWPMVAGKTVTDPLYKLKLFKENVRGALIFGNLQRADYLIFLAVKRSLEIEKLLQESNLPAAQKTVILEQLTLTKAGVSYDHYKSAGDTDTSGLGPQMVIRLDSMTKLFTWLGAKNSQNKELLQPLVDQVQALKVRL